MMAADQHLCFYYTYSTITLLPESEISSLKQSSMFVQPILCRTWLKTPKTDFLMTWLILFQTLSATCHFQDIQSAVDTTVGVLQCGIPIARIG